MMNQTEIWELGYQVKRKLPSYYADSMEKAAEELGLESPTCYSLITAYTFLPDPISVDRLRVRSPYNSPGFYRERIRGLYEEGCLAPSDLGGYSLTASGIEATKSIMSAAYQAMEEIPVLNKEEMRSLTHVSGRLVQACLIHGPLISKWSIIYSRRLDEAPEDAYTAKLDQYLSDLNSYRDDVHLASWSQHNIDGHAWDVLTATWREGLGTIGELSEILSSRGWSQDETGEAIDELRNRGWIEGADKLSITELGKEIREEAELLTDSYFYAPWASVEQKDLKTLSDLLPKLAAKLELD